MTDIENYSTLIDGIFGSGTIMHATGDTTFSYILTIVDSTQNSALDTIQIKRLYIHTTFDNDSILCPGEAISFGSQNSSFSQVFYSFNDTIHSLLWNQFTPTQPGIYSFGISFANCGNDTVFSQPKNIIIENPQINLGNDTMLCVNTQFQVMAPPGFKSYYWSNGDSAVSTTENSVVEDTIQLICSIISQEQCSTSDTILIMYSNCNMVRNLNLSTTIKFYSNTHTLEINNPFPKSLPIVVRDINGRDVLKFNVGPLQKRNFDLRLPTGVYFYHTDMGLTGKIILTQ